jgi:hypothetical protein
MKCTMPSVSLELHMKEAQSSFRISPPSIMSSDISKPDPNIAVTTPHSHPSSTLSTTEAERRLRWKIDLYVVPVVAVLYALCTIDRVNIGNARLAGFERSLDLHGNDFNVLLSIFYVSYILCSVPATWVTKWIGPAWVLPGTTLVFGVLTVSFAFVKVRSQLWRLGRCVADDEVDFCSSSSREVPPGYL